MLLLASLDQKKQADRLALFLRSIDIDCQCQSHDDQHEVWVIHETHLEQAKNELALFQADPDNPKYRVKSAKKKDTTAALKASYKRHFKRPRRATITLTLMVVTILVFILQRSPWGAHASVLLMASPGAPIVSQWAYQPWRLLTPMFLHFSLLHIAFNLYWLYYLGGLIEVKESRWFFIWLIVCSDLVSNMLQLLFVGPFFGGLSGIIYALFGYLWISARFHPWSGYYVRSDIAFWMLGWLVLGFIGILGPVANFGHLGGLLVGVLAAKIQRR